MSDGASLFSPALEDEFFLQGEYFKRNFEDNADIETIEWLKKNCFSQPELEKFILSDKITIIRECIYKRDKETKGEEYIPNIEMPFNTDKKRKWVTRLHDISLKYKVYAPELLLPYDFIDVLTKINAGIPLPHTRLFNDEQDADYIYQQYGYIATVKGETHPKNLVLEIHFSDEHKQQHDLIQRISSEIAMFKKINKIEINDSDIEYLKLVSSQDKSKTFRTSSFYNRAIGICAWDLLKEYKISLDGVRKKLLDKKLYKYNKRHCSTSDCDFCESLDNCYDALEDSYKIAASSIEEGKIVPTSQKVKKTCAKRCKIDIPRVPTSLFEDTEG